jgi:hypothetical protein
MQKSKIHNVFKPITFGLCAGAIVSVLILIPLIYISQQNKTIEARQQPNLVDSGGVALGHIQTYPVEITVKNDDGEVSDMSVSADGFRWYTPVDGTATLELAAGSLNLRAAYKNRLINRDFVVSPEGVNLVELDIGHAPNAPEITFHSLKQGQVSVIPLGITNAEAVILYNEPSGITMKKELNEFLLEINGGLLSHGFYPIAAEALNEAGSTKIQICLMIPRETPVIPINTVDELIAVNENLSGSYLLLNDLDMTDVDFQQIGSEEFPFTGAFDGGGHTISGYSVTGQKQSSGIFRYCRNAVVKNLIVRDIYVNCERDDDNTYYYASICAIARGCLIQNCASINGEITGFSSNAHMGGIVTHSGNNVITGCFNSTNVINNTPLSQMPETGGICSVVNGGYIENCANEGYIYGNHLPGGIAGYVTGGTLGGSIVNRCLNSGIIYGSPLINNFPPGAIMTTIDYGRVSYCYFAQGLAAAGRVYKSGTITGIKPVEKTAFRDNSLLGSLGGFGGNNPGWAYASLDAFGPIPFGVFKDQTSAPIIVPDDARVDVPAIDGVLYYYSLDGGDPYTACPEGVESISMTLKKGQSLRVFAARSGMRDSEIAEYREAVKV